MIVRIVEPSICLGSPDDLEIMAVQMERMLSGVVVIQDDFNDLALLEDESVGITAVYYGI